MNVCVAAHMLQLKSYLGCQRSNAFAASEYSGRPGSL
jgi:hypothetical protein